MPFLYYTHKKIYLKRMDCSQNKRYIIIFFMSLVTGLFFVVICLNQQ